MVIVKVFIKLSIFSENITLFFVCLSLFSRFLGPPHCFLGTVTHPFEALPFCRLKAGRKEGLETVLLLGVEVDGGREKEIEKEREREGIRERQREGGKEGGMDYILPPVS